MTTGRAMNASVSASMTAGSGSARKAAYRPRSVSVDQCPPAGAKARRSDHGSIRAVPVCGLMK